jgi:hypothetical protein
LYLAVVFRLWTSAFVGRYSAIATAALFGARNGHAEEDLGELVQVGRLPRHGLYPEVPVFATLLAALLAVHDNSPVSGFRPA